MTDKSAQTDPLAALAASVLALPQEKFLAAIALIDPLADQAPVERLMTLARPRLRTLRPTRRPTLKRLLCMPFEDLLFTAPDGHGRIARHEIEPIWRMLCRDNQVRIDGLQRELRGLAARDGRRLAALSERLWRLGAAALEAERTSEGQRAGETRFLVRNALAAAPEIEAFKRAWPSTPLARLDPAAGKRVMDGLNGLVARNRPIDAFLLVVASRLARPADLTALLRTEGFPVPLALAERLGQAVGDTLARDGLALAEAAPDTSPEAIADAAFRLLDGADDAVRSAGSRTRPSAEASRRRAADLAARAVTERVIDPARTAIGQALGEASDHDRLIEAEAFARALGRTIATGRGSGLDRPARAAADQIRGDLDAELDRLVAAGRGPDESPNPADRETRRLAAYRAVRLVEQLDGPTAAAPLLDRARREI